MRVHVLPSVRGVSAWRCKRWCTQGGERREGWCEGIVVSRNCLVEESSLLSCCIWIVLHPRFQCRHLDGCERCFMH